MKHKFNGVRRRIRDLEDFYEGMTSDYGYVDVLKIAGGKRIEKVERKYGIPVVKFSISLGSSIQNEAKRILGDDENYFEGFDYCRRQFPKNSWILNNNKTILSFDNATRKMTSRTGLKNLLNRNLREIYSKLCFSDLINFGNIPIPFDYLWGNRRNGGLFNNTYCIDLGNSLVLDLKDGEPFFN